MTTQNAGMFHVLGKALGCLQRIGVPNAKLDQGQATVTQAAAVSSSTTCTESIPSVDVLNVRFEEFVAEMDLDTHHQDVLLNLEPSKKWQLLCEQSHRQELAKQDCSFLQYVEFLQLAVKDGVTFYQKSGNARMALERLESLRIALRTQPNSFVVQFLDNNGLELVLGILNQIRIAQQLPDLMVALLGCIKSLLNNSGGRAYVLEHHSAIKTITQTLLMDEAKVKIIALEILGATCLIQGGQKTVLDAMSNLMQDSFERFRFQLIVSDLAKRCRHERSSSRRREETQLKTAIMSFINALLKCGDAEESFELRFHIRYELLMLGIQNIIDGSRDRLDSPVLENHFDLFEMMRQEDEEELGRRYDENCNIIDTISPMAILSAVVDKTEQTDAVPHLLSILNHMLLFPTDKYGTSYWRLLDRICQQIAVQLPSGQDPDVQALELDFRTTMQQIDLETELDRAHEEIESLQEKLAEAHRSLAVATQQQQQQQQEASSARSLALKQHRSSSPSSLNSHFDHADVQSVSSGVESIESDEQNGTDCHPNDDCLSSPDQQNKSHSFMARLSTCIPPAPPLPPPFPGSPTHCQSHFMNRKTPKPCRPLKTFNWTRIPEDKLEGTIWLELNEEKLYNQLNLEDFCEKFSAVPRQQSDEDGHALDGPDPYDTLRYAPKRLSVIDPRRAQNLNILLSKFKLRNSDVVNAIITMDTNNVLVKDLLEQLLKFMPTPEELSLLNDYRSQAHLMARADRFMIDISGIPRYQEKVQCLYFQKVFTERMNEIKPKIEVVTKASRATLNSKRLRKLLELVLAIGNYMNYGKRWKEAAGFHMNALGILTETRSTVRRDYTLLHYLVEVAESNFPELLRMKRELNVVTDASKISYTDLEAEVQMMTSGIAQMKSEIKHRQQAANDDDDDQTVSVRTLSDGSDQNYIVEALTTFLSVAAPEVSSLEQKYKEMKTAFWSFVKKFGGSPKQASPDEAFHDLAQFLQSFSATYRQIQLSREEEERRKRTLAKIPTRPRFVSNGSSLSRFLRGTGIKPANGSGEFDQLVSALQSGELFTEELKRLRTSFRGSTRLKKPTRKNIISMPTDGSTDDRSDVNSSKASPHNQNSDSACYVR